MSKYYVLYDVLSDYSLERVSGKSEYGNLTHAKKRGVKDNRGRKITWRLDSKWRTMTAAGVKNVRAWKGANEHEELINIIVEREKVKHVPKRGKAKRVKNPRKGKRLSDTQLNKLFESRAFDRPRTKAMLNFLRKESPHRVTGLSIEPDGVFIYTNSDYWRDDAGAGTFREDSETLAIKSFYERVEPGRLTKKKNPKKRRRKKNPVHKKRTKKKTTRRKRNPGYKGFTIARLKPKTQRVEFWNGKSWGTFPNAIAFTTIANAQKYGPKPRFKTSIQSVNVAPADIRKVLVGKVKRRRNPVGPTQREVDRAANLYKDFSGDYPEQMTRVKLPVPKTGLVIGELDGVLYTTTRDGKRESYIHEFGKKRRPHLISSHDGESLHILGGDYEFTERGIEG